MSDLKRLLVMEMLKQGYRSETIANQCRVSRDDVEKLKLVLYA